MEPNNYIVPYDFTNVTDNALKYALFVARKTTNRILLLHVTTGKESNESAMKRLQEVIDKLDLKVGDNEVIPHVVNGSIFEEIPKFAKEHNTRLIFMGTHGAVGMQKVFGSYAMTIVTSTEAPFLIVQEGATHHTISNILVPISYQKETLQIANIAIRIADLFGAKIHVVTEDFSDELLRQKVKISINFLEKHFTDFNIEHDYISIKGGTTHNGILKYAKKNNIDLLATAHFTESIMPQFDRFTQGLITNKDNIPCLVINSKLLTSLYF